MRYHTPKIIHPTKKEKIENPSYYKNKILSYRGQDIVFDQDIRFGTCLCCKQTVVSGEIKYTQLHHFWYNDDDPLEGTIELCNKCHYKIDPKNRFVVNKRIGVSQFVNIYPSKKKTVIKIKSTKLTEIKSKKPNSQKIKAQKKHAKAYERWSVEDNEFLLKFWNTKLHTQNQEKTIQELSEKLCRNRGGIESKLMKFGLIFDKYRNSRLTDGV